MNKPFVIAALFALLLPAADASAVKLAWKDNANNEVGAIVRRSLTQYQPGTATVVNAGSFGILLQVVGADLESLDDLSAVADINYDNEYCYMVDAYNLDNAGNIQESGHSNVACIKIPRPNPPVALPARPSNLTAAP